MKILRRFVGLFQNSPSFGRDRANLISSVTIGTTAVALNGVILSLILPLILDPDDRDFRLLTENIEFGQLLGLVLLGGATAFATFLIPMRIVTVFMAPRVGRYFDQIVLSGITPLRFLIGRATSQNLFLALILFLLLPWFVLVLSLGGLEWSVFLGNLFLVWLYCMMLSLLMLWLSLYLNEVLAMLILMYAVTLVCALGCAPLPFQPFVVTPFPALMHSVYTAVGVDQVAPAHSFFTVFAFCAAGMTIVSGLSLAAIYLGPLYGIIRDNSTFGEIVRAGDSKRKRRFRFRLHIQRPSEIAFFYENRGDAFRKHEGLVRWGAAFLGLMIVAGTAWSTLIIFARRSLPSRIAANVGEWWVDELHITFHSFHAVSLVLAVFLFSHVRNTTYQRLPMLLGWKPEVARLDTIGFMLSLLISTAAGIGVPVWIDQVVAIPAGSTVFPTEGVASGADAINLSRISIEGTLALSVVGLTLYFLQRTVCLNLWMKSTSMVAAAMTYGGFISILPLMFAVITREIPELERYSALYDNAPQLAMVSPAVLLMFLYGEMGPLFSEDLTTVPFYVVHTMIMVACLFMMRRVGRKLRMEYSPQPEKETRG